MQLLVAVFDNPETAHEARSAVRDLERQLFVAVEDAAVISRDANPAALRAALEPFRGRAIQTRVDPELAEQLRDVLKQ